MTIRHHTPAMRGAYQIDFVRQIAAPRGDVIHEHQIQPAEIEREQQCCAVDARARLFVASCRDSTNRMPRERERCRDQQTVHAPAQTEIRRMPLRRSTPSCISMPIMFASDERDYQQSGRGGSPVRADGAAIAIPTNAAKYTSARTTKKGALR